MYWNVTKMDQLIMFKLIGGEKGLTKKRLHFEHSSFSLCINYSTAAVFQVVSFCPKAKLKPCFFCFYNNTSPHSRIPGWTRQTGALYLPVCSFWHSVDLPALISLFTHHSSSSSFARYMLLSGATRFTLNLFFVCTHLHLSIKVTASQTCTIKQLLKCTK